MKKMTQKQFDMLKSKLIETATRAKDDRRLYFALYNTGEITVHSNFIESPNIIAGTCGQDWAKGDSVEEWANNCAWDIVSEVHSGQAEIDFDTWN